MNETIPYYIEYYQKNKERLRQKNRDYYHKKRKYNKNLIIYRKKYYQKNKDYSRIKNKNWRNKNREKIRQCSRERYKKTRIEQIKYSRKYHKKEREELKELIGNKCFVCGKSPKNIFFHEVHNKKHVYSTNYIKIHYKDFIPLCNGCHMVYHIYLKYRDKFNAIYNIMIVSTFAIAENI